MVTARARRWDEVYSSKQADDVSWFQREPVQSLELLAVDGPLPDSVVDVGAGESVLVDRLIAAGVGHVTVLDVSAEAIAHIGGRLGARPAFESVVADVTAWVPARAYGAWHDRAVLHFLTDDEDRRAYARVAASAVRPGGIAVIGVFAADGPEACSGLPVHRSDERDIRSLFAEAFDLLRTVDEQHSTPWGVVQHFLWVVLRRQ